MRRRDHKFDLSSCPNHWKTYLPAPDESLQWESCRLIFSLVNNGSIIHKCQPVVSSNGIINRNLPACTFPDDLIINTLHIVPDIGGTACNRFADDFRFNL